MATQPGVGYTFTTSSQGENFNVIHPWAMYPLISEYEPNQLPYIHPYKVVDYNVESFKVIPGTFNNLPTMVDGTQGASPKWLTDTPAPTITWNWDATTNKSYVYLVGGPNTTTNIYPSPVTTTAAYPGVGSWDNPVTDSNAYSYLMIAEAKRDPTSSVITVTQYVTGSIWSDRIKIGDQTARYYHARI